MCRSSIDSLLAEERYVVVATQYRAVCQCEWNVPNEVRHFECTVLSLSASLIDKRLTHS